MPATDLFDAADEILSLCALLLADTTGGLPDRVYVSQGLDADECSELTVRVTIGEGALGTPGQAHKTGRRNEVTFTVRVVRCRPQGDDQGNPPTVEELNAYARITYQDAWAIWNGIMAAKRAGNLLTGFCAEFDMDTGTPIPTTQVGGWEIQLRAPLYAYTPDIST
jgi:hypothetical protein